VPLCAVEQPARRDAIDPNGVQAIRRHLGEVLLDSLQVVVLVAVRIRAKRPVSDATDPQLFFVDVDELAADSGPHSCRYRH